MSGWNFVKIKTIGDIPLIFNFVLKLFLCKNENENGRDFCHLFYIIYLFIHFY